MSAASARRHGSSLRALERAGLTTSVRRLAPTYRGAERPFKLAFSDPKYLQVNAGDLRHLMALSVLRRDLGAIPKDWAVHALNRKSGNSPDAFWTRYGGKVPIEYDSGSYPVSKILEKASAFLAYDVQIWSSTSRARCRTLQATLRTVTDRAEVIFTEL